MVFHRQGINMRTQTLQELLRERGINSKIMYDTLIVYGNFVLHDHHKPIDFQQPNVIVRGICDINNCSALKILPEESIQADQLEIQNCTNIMNWPEKLASDELIKIRNCGGYDTLFDTKIFCGNLMSDCPGHEQDLNRVFSYVVHCDDPQNFRSSVVDYEGTVVFSLDPVRAISLHEMGFIKDLNDPQVVGSFLREIQVIDESAKLFAKDDAEQFWKSYCGQSVTKTSSAGMQLG